MLCLYVRHLRQSNMAIFLGTTKDMNREAWKEMRRHGKDGKIDVTLGGSDVGYILEDVEDFDIHAQTPYDKTRSSYASCKELLWRQKRCEYLRIPYKGRTARGNAVRDGVFNEDYVAARYMDQTGETVIGTPGMYQHDTYDFALANPDGFILTDEHDSLSPAPLPLPIPRDWIKSGFEAKTTDIEKKKEVIMKWKAGIVPFNYFCQCLHYMFVLDIDKWVTCCLWGIRVEDYATIPIFRDAKCEEILAENEYAFIKSVKAGTPPPLPVGKDYLIKVVKEQFAESRPGKLVRFNQKEHGGLFKDYNRENQECARLSRLLNEAKQRREKHEALIRALMEENTTGVLESRLNGQYTERYNVSLKGQTKDYIPPEKLKAIAPDVFDQCNEPSQFRVLRVTRKVERG